VKGLGLKRDLNIFKWENGIWQNSWIRYASVPYRCELHENHCNHCLNIARQVA
jgi:hypothetical protein